MRIFPTLLRRLPQKEWKVPFKTTHQLRLNNSVSGKSDRSTEVASLQELTVMFASLKRHDFDQSRCQKEIEALRSSHRAYLAKRFHEKQLGGDTLVPGNKLNYRQLNKLLRKFPNPV